MSLEEKKKAEIKFEKSGMSMNLIKFINSTEHYHAWVKNSNDFEELYNFGLQDIRTEKVDIDIYYNEKIEYLTVANYKNIKIKFGNKSYYVSYPDGDGASSEVVLFYIEDKLIVHAKYSRNDEAYSYKDFGFYSLEEFHYTIEFEKMLSEMSKDIDDLAIKNKKLDKLKEEEKYKGKFSFDD
jgi:hypothetical protein